MISAAVQDLPHKSDELPKVSTTSEPVHDVALDFFVPIVVAVPATSYIRNIASVVTVKVSASPENVFFLSTETVIPLIVAEDGINASKSFTVK